MLRLFIWRKIQFVLKIVLVLIVLGICFCAIFTTLMVISSSVIYYLFFSARPLLYYHYPLHFMKSVVPTNAIISSNGYTQPVMSSVLYSVVPLRKEFNIFFSKEQSHMKRIQQVDLELCFPENELMMQHVGMFNIKMQVIADAPHLYMTDTTVDHYSALGANSKILFTSHTSCMLQYKSNLLRWLDTLFFAPLYLTGWWQQMQRKHVNLLIHNDTILIEQFNNMLQYSNASSIRIELSDDRIQLYSANIHFNAHVVGWRYYTYHYKYLIWSILLPILVINNSIASLVILVIAYILIYTSKNQNKERMESALKEQKGKLIEAKPIVERKEMYKYEKISSVEWTQKSLHKKDVNIPQNEEEKPYKSDFQQALDNIIDSNEFNENNNNLSDETSDNSLLWSEIVSNESKLDSEESSLRNRRKNKVNE